MTVCDLTKKNCKPCEGGVPKLTVAEVRDFLSTMHGWQSNADSTEIQKEFDFKDYYQTMAFVNAIAWFTHAENHHPDMEVSYNKCTVRYSTHAIDGLSENDFICAAKVDALTF
jgi:4a-hydroxytetrahydrobiopterin dehydratase